MGSKHFAYGLGGGLLAAGLLGATGSADDLEDGREGRDELPFRRGEVRLRISEDIAEDERARKRMLAGRRARSREEVHDIMVRRSTLARRQTSAIMATKRGEEGIATELEESEAEAAKTPYQMATDLALNRAATRRLTRQAKNAREVTGSAPDSIAAIAELNSDEEEN